jgi:hypothetical protein
MADDVYQLEIGMQGAGRIWENVLHFQGNLANSTSPETDAGALIASFISGMEASFLSMMATDVLILGYRAKRVNNTGGPSTVTIRSGTTLGTFTGTIDNTRDTASIEADYYFAAGTPPRWRAGGIRVGGLADGAMNDNVWAGAFQTAAAAFISDLISDASASPGPWESGIWSTKASIFYPSDNWELSPRMGGMKRRNRNPI